MCRGRGRDLAISWAQAIRCGRVATLKDQFITLTKTLERVSVKNVLRGICPQNPGGSTA